VDDAVGFSNDEKTASIAMKGLIGLLPGQSASWQLV
jgi:hypothetical protein